MEKQYALSLLLMVSAAPGSPEFHVRSTFVPSVIVRHTLMGSALDPIFAFSGST